MKFFAEGLPRLGVVNLQLQLQTPSNSSTTVSTTAGREHAVLSHDGEVSTLLLPCAASSQDTCTFTSGQLIIKPRILTSPTKDSVETVPLLSADDIGTHWSLGAKLSCAYCHRVLVNDRQIRWKDLPSDSWLEYSDYWLCHSGQT